MALKYHPDRNNSPLSHIKMAQINEAYEILSNHQKRKEYDKLKDYSNDKAKEDNVEYEYNFENVKDEKDSREYKRVNLKWQILYSLIPVVNLWAFYKVGRTFMSLAVLTPVFIGSFLTTLMIESSYFQSSLMDNSSAISMTFEQMSITLLLNGLSLIFLMFKWSSEWNNGLEKDGYGHTKDHVDLKWQLIFSIIPFLNISAFARVEKLGASIAVVIPIYIVSIIIGSIFSNILLPFVMTFPIFAFLMLRWTREWNCFN